MSVDAYRALRTGAVAFRRESTCLRVSGPDRVAWLQGMVSNDVGRLAPGQGCLAAHLSPQGKLLALLVVLADPECLWLVAAGGYGDSLHERLDGLLIMEDALLEDRSGDFRLLSLVGDGAERALEPLCSPVASLGMYDHRLRGPLRVVRTASGYDLLAPASDEKRVLEELSGGGVVQGDEDLRRVVWVERGLGSWGADLDPTVTLPEIGEDAIDYQKGCYIGQEVVAKIKYIGHVNRRFRGLRFEGDSVPAPGPLQVGGRDVGRLTSAVRSPEAGGVIGLGFLKRGSDAAGTEVEAGGVHGTVSDLPFV